ncbi:T9SS type A sorting domain-containing protein [Winogradskyella flava]|uniref:T9SS type A sorting domain-containing protein n=1 Tax=Winogradskyella flava TaxID=1884876 RepID=A0A842ISZ8_9FLAO|nr:T9SS type A sorting domain-containing protein [Winogradskyella flava]MBC2846292.1 T9SS type A sorting domain-containing protein [Winogradskyella flava]
MKKLLFFTVLSCALFLGNAQNNAYYNRMQHIFGNINKSKVTTGYLKEFGIRFNEIEAYNGVLNTNNVVDKTQWQSLYSSLYTMRIGSVAESMTAPNMVFDNLETQQNNSTQDVLFAAQYYAYQQYKDKAVSNGDVKVIKDRIYDVKGRNPYDTKTIFAVSPLKKQLQGNTFTFKLPSSLIYTNSSSTLNQVQIDFDDGNGYQTVTLNSAQNITYTSGGEKELRVKFSYSNGTKLYSQSKIWVDYISSGGSNQARFNGFGLLFNEEPITGNPYQGSSTTGLVTVELAPGHTQLTKPLIVVEGFDPNNSFDYDSLINFNNPGGLLVDIIAGAGFNSLNQAIEDEDYDLVFVDFENSTDFIQRNAYMLEAVIDWVNNQKVGNEQNVVLGMSMGGLVARYALRDMEINGETHDTKLYISHDTPHQGANVPLAFQAFVRHLVGEEIGIPVFFSLFDINIVDLSDEIPGLEEGLALLRTPAAQQMLTYQLQGTGDNVSVDNTTLYSSFLTEYSTMGYPQQNGIRNIAIANGSECGTPLEFNPYDKLVDINVRVDLPFFVTNIALAILNGLSVNPLKALSSLLSTDTDIKAQFRLRALPSQQSKQIYKGKIFIEKTILFLVDVEEPLIDEERLNSLSSMLPLDNASGGIFDLEGFANLPQELDQYVLERQFNFIPTYSSLDIGSGTQTIGIRDLNKTYSPLSPPRAPKDVPFDNFFTNDLNSEQHIQFTLNNGNWLIEELDDDNEEGFYSCASNCPNDLPLVIIGSDQICNSSSETYYVNNLRPGVLVNWSVSPTGGFTLTQNGNSATLTPTGYFGGRATLTAFIETDCNDVEIAKEIQTGSQRPIIYGKDGEQIASFSFCTLHYGYINFTTPSSAFEWEWNQVSGNFNMLTTYNNAQFFSYQPTSGIVTVRTRDNCGWSVPTFLVIEFTNCSDGGDFDNFRLAQNPIKNDNLEIVETAVINSNVDTAYTIDDNTKVTIKLFDFSGNLLKTKKRTRNLVDGKYQLNTSEFPNGKYFLKIIHNNTEQVFQIILDK